MLYSILPLPEFSPKALHIPDGFLSAPVAILAWLVTAAFIIVAIRKANQELDERLVPLMGVLAAFIFAAQAFNFPVAGGTSGHMLGGALAAILLAPWPALLVMTAVIAVQGLVFQDGGLLAMGTNIFIMGIVTVWAGYFVYRALARFHRPAAAFVAGWLGVELAAIITAFLLAISGTVSLAVVLPAMGGVHALIGIGEGLITAAALALVSRAMPGMMEGDAENATLEAGTVVAGGIVLALVVGILAVFFASGSPDGLERVAENTGFLGAAQGPLFDVIPGYIFPGISNGSVAGILAIVIGTLLLLAIGYAIARALRQRRQSQAA